MLEERFPLAHLLASDVQSPVLTALVLQMTALTVSPEASDQPTLNVIALPALTGSGESDREVIEGAPFTTSKVPELDDEQALVESHTNA